MRQLLTSSISQVSVVADAVILVALGAAVSSPKRSSLARLMIATVAFVCAWLTTALDAARPRDWTVFLGVAVIVVSIVLVIVSLHIWAQANDGGESGAGPGGDQDGGGPGRRWPDAPKPGGGGNDPSWWPEFERHLALYVAEGEKVKRQPAVLPDRRRTPSSR
jgi:hypothetical protein